MSPKIQPVVRFVTLFHKRVLPDVLNALPGSPSDPDALNAALDALPQQSNAVVLAMEEFIAALYAPQKPDVLAAALSSLVEATRQLHRLIAVDVLMPRADLAKEMGALSVKDAQDGASAGKTKDARKWFASCLAQIEKSAEAADEMLSTQAANPT